MGTQCTPEQRSFHHLGRRGVVARFDAGRLTSDGGSLLLREADRRLELTRRMARCLTDRRQVWRVEHDVRSLVVQRVHGLALGYATAQRGAAWLADWFLTWVIWPADYGSCARSQKPRDPIKRIARRRGAVYGKRVVAAI